MNKNELFIRHRSEQLEADIVQRFSEYTRAAAEFSKQEGRPSNKDLVYIMRLVSYAMFNIARENFFHHGQNSPS